MKNKTTEEKTNNNLKKKLHPLLKPLGNSSVIDFEKVDKLNFPVNLIISERNEKGKTYGLTELIFDTFIKENRVGRWIMNTEDQIELTMRDWGKNNSLNNPQKWGSFEIKNQSGIYAGKEIVRFYNLSAAYKTKASRDQTIKHVVYDEFNEGLRQIGNKQSSFLDTMIQSFKSKNEKTDIKLWILGNYNSLSTPLLVDMGIYAIQDEVVKIYDYNAQPRLLIYVPVIDREEKEKELQHDWTFWFSKRVGNAEHSFFNKSVLDNINGVIKSIPQGAVYFATYKLDGRFYNFYSYENKKRYVELTKLPPDNKPIYVVDKKETEHGYTLVADAKKVFLEWLRQGVVYFDNVATKLALIDSL